MSVKRAIVLLLVVLAAMLVLADIVHAGPSDGNGRPLAGWTWDRAEA